MARERKRASCPNCLPQGSKGKAFFTRDSDFVDGEWIRYWSCQNCGHRLPVGKTPDRAAKQRAVLDKLNAALDSVRANTTTNGYPWNVIVTETVHDRGIAWEAAGSYGREGTLLSHVSHRFLTVMVTTTGALRVIYDSKNSDDESKARVERDLRRGRLGYW